MYVLLLIREQLITPYSVSYMNISKTNSRYWMTLSLVIGIDGVKHETPIIEATFNFGGEDYTSSFSVLDATDAVMTVQEESGIQIHGVLGTSFFVENKWVIDFKNCVVRED